MDAKWVQIAMKGSAIARGSNVVSITNVYTFERTTTANPRVKANVESAFQTAIGDTVLTALNEDYVQSSNDVRWLDDATDIPAAFPETGVGAQAGERYETFTAAYVLMRTAFRGTRGSKHYGPVAEADVNGDQLTSGALTRFAAVAAAILAGFTDSDGNVWFPVVIQAASAVLDSNPTLFNPAGVVSCQARKTMGTMRRRKVKGVY
jgi:hypothetical protein